MAEDLPENEDFSSFLNITENRSRILAVIIAMVRDFNVAEDLFQETVVEILRSKDRFVPGQPFFPWAYGISKNVVYRYWKRENRRPLSITREVLARLAEVSTDTEPALWRKEKVALQECLDELPLRLKKLFILRYGHNVKGESLAGRTDIKRGSIRTSLARLRNRLRQCINMRIRNNLRAGYEL